LKIEKKDKVKPKEPKDVSDHSATEHLKPADHQKYLKQILRAFRKSIKDEFVRLYQKKYFNWIDETQR